MLDEGLSKFSNGSNRSDERPVPEGTGCCACGGCAYEEGWRQELLQALEHDPDVVSGPAKSPRAVSACMYVSGDGAMLQKLHWLPAPADVCQGNAVLEAGITW